MAPEIMMTVMPSPAMPTTAVCRTMSSTVPSSPKLLGPMSRNSPYTASRASTGPKRFRTDRAPA